MNEFVIEWLKGQTVASVTAPSGTALKTRLLKLAELYPDECDCLENADGSVFGHVPIKYIKVSHPKKVSEEQRQKLADRLKEMRSNSALGVSDDDLDLEE